MLKFKFSILLLVLSFSLRLGAQESSTSSSITLTLQSAAERALQHYEKTKIAESDVEEARGQKWQSYSLALPSLMGNYRYTRNLKKPSIFFENGKVPIGFDNVHAFDVSLIQPLTRFGGIYHGIRSAERAYGASRFAYAQTQADVVFEAREAYFRVLLDEARLRTAKASLEQAQEVLTREQARYRVGEIAEFDFNRASLECENKQADLMQAEGDLQVSQQRLRRILGTEPDQLLNLVDSMENFAKPIVETEFITKLTASPTLEASRRRASSAEQARKAAKADFFPNLNFFSSYESVGQSSDRFFPNSEEFYHAVSLGLNVEVPIFDGMLRVGKYKSAEAKAQRASFENAATEKDLRLSLTQALSEAKTQFARQSSNQKSLHLAETLYSQARLRFKNGMISFIDLKDVQTQLDAARLRYLASLYNYVMARAKVEQIVGNTEWE